MARDENRAHLVLEKRLEETNDNLSKAIDKINDLSLQLAKYQPVMENLAMQMTWYRSEIESQGKRITELEKQLAVLITKVLLITSACALIVGGAVNWIMNVTLTKIANS